MAKVSLGLDYGTNSVRALVVDVMSGEELASSVWNYAHGDMGILLDQSDPNIARQHPADYLQGLTDTVVASLKEAKAKKQILPSDVIGIGVDTTGSTPLPLDAEGDPLVNRAEYSDNLAAMAWLWKDHTAHREANEITNLAAKIRPQYLQKCGGTYSSEWFWAKLLRCKRAAPELFAAAYTWVEIADWIPAVLTGTTHPTQLRRCICAAGHKAMFHPSWGGYPDAEFLAELDAELVRVRQSLPDTAVNISQSVGGLSAEWAKRLGLPEGIPVAAGAFDAHLGAVGSGIQPGVLVKILGTSCCDLMTAPMSIDLPDIPGLCGIVPESVLPEAYGIEAGQSAVGDIFNWFVNQIAPGGDQKGSHQTLTAEAENLHPGTSGLLALDWHNGNRTILVDQRLTGMILGLTLHTKPAEIYRSLIEATAFGARAIIERMEEYGVKVDRVINCGGISIKNPMVMQIYADVFNRPMEISRSSQTCALGSAMAGAVVAGKAGGGHDSFAEAAEAMTGVLERNFVPIGKNVKIYDRLYRLYMAMHDAHGINGQKADISHVMKDLLQIRDEART